MGGYVTAEKCGGRMPLPTAKRAGQPWGDEGRSDLAKRLQPTAIPADGRSQIRPGPANTIAIGQFYLYPYKLSGWIRTPPCTGAGLILLPLNRRSSRPRSPRARSKAIRAGRRTFCTPARSRSCPENPRDRMTTRRPTSREVH